MSDEELAALRRELDDWCLAHGPIGLTEAVLADREESW